LEKNILLDDELSKHFHIAWKIIMGVSQGRDTDICEKGLSLGWQHQYIQVLTVKLDAN
jgi:hypothetical protein